MQIIDFFFTLPWLGSMGAWLVGQWDERLKILCVLILIDYFTGFAKAIITGNLSRVIGWKGVFKKALICIAIMVAHLLDKILMEGASIIISSSTTLRAFEGAGMIRSLTILFYAINETFSIIENLQASGVKIPKFIERILKELEERLNEKGEDHTD